MADVNENIIVFSAITNINIVHVEAFLCATVAIVPTTVAIVLSGC